MPASRHVTLFHSPQSRSAGALILLEELDADYELHVLNLKKGEQPRRLPRGQSDGQGAGDRP